MPEVTGDYPRLGALGLPLATVDVRVRRIGGAYGGKLNAHLPTAIAAAVAAAKHGRPVRLHNDRSDDMASTGGRPPMEGSFRLAVDQGGVPSSLELPAAPRHVRDMSATCPDRRRRLVNRAHRGVRLWRRRRRRRRPDDGRLL